MQLSGKMESSVPREAQIPNNLNRESLEYQYKIRVRLNLLNSLLVVEKSLNKRHVVLILHGLESNKNT